MKRRHTGSRSSMWPDAIRRCADAPRARHYFDLFKLSHAGSLRNSVQPEQARVLAALFSGSQALSELLLARPEWLPALDAELLRHPRREQGLEREVHAWLKPLLGARNFSGAFAKLRE